MAYKKYNYQKPNKSYNSKFTSAERLAYRMGQIQRGLSNPGSRVFESYNKGLENKPTGKKPLF